MKKSKKKTALNPEKNSKLCTLSDTSESNSNIDSADEFVLFPLDVQETKQIIHNSADSQDDDFILFPLDVKTTVNTNNPAPITNQKNSKPKRQFATKPKPININPKPANQPIPSPIPVNRPANKKLSNIFWFVLICLCLYTYNKKDSNESYIHFLSKTRDKIGNTFNFLKSDYSNEDDFI